MFVIVSGSSGVGKNTILNELFKLDSNIKNFVSYTTRDMREGEIDGVHYHFLSKPEFQKLNEQGKFCEVEEIHGNYYGCQIEDILHAIDSDQILIKDLGVEGAQNLEKIFGQDKIVTIFIDAPRDVLRQRLIDRGEKALELRLSRYDYEHTFVSNYDYVVQNIDLAQSVKQVLSIIREHQFQKKEQCQKQNEIIQ